MPARTMTSGSGTRFVFKRMARVAAAIKEVGMSKMALLPSTNAAPAIAPVAAAVTPSTNDFNCGLFAKRRKYGAGITTNR